jgi:hypothetical protein
MPARAERRLDRATAKVELRHMDVTRLGLELVDSRFEVDELIKLITARPR